MVVKSVRGRRRYVFFRVPADLRRDGLEGILEGIASVKVVTCRDGEAVVRCSPADRAEAVGRVEASGGESVLTSGTLRTLREAYPSLKVPQKRRRRRSGGPKRGAEMFYTAPFITVAVSIRSRHYATRTDGL